jgi:hypothetical protein
MDGDVDVSDVLLQSPTTQFGRVLVLNFVSLLCKITMNFMNRTTVKNHKAVELLQERGSGQALITVSNHTR